MISLVWDEAFRRKYRKLAKKNEIFRIEFITSLELFVENPYNQALKTHKLSGKLNDCWAFSINYSMRVVFQFLEQDSVLLIDIGTHDEVY